MDCRGLWLGTGANTTVTLSCMSCHKAHGNKNAFGLIFMKGTGTRTEEPTAAWISAVVPRAQGA